MGLKQGSSFLQAIWISSVCQEGQGHVSLRGSGAQRAVETHHILDSFIWASRSLIAGNQPWLTRPVLLLLSTRYGLRPGFHSQVSESYSCALGSSRSRSAIRRRGSRSNAGLIREVSKENFHQKIDSMSTPTCPSQENPNTLTCS